MAPSKVQGSSKDGRDGMVLHTTGSLWRNSGVTHAVLKTAKGCVHEGFNTSIITWSHPDIVDIENYDQRIRVKKARLVLLLSL